MVPILLQGLSDLVKQRCADPPAPPRACVPVVATGRPATAPPPLVSPALHRQPSCLLANGALCSAGRMTLSSTWPPTS